MMFFRKEQLTKPWSGSPTLTVPSSIIDKLGLRHIYNNLQIDKPRGGKYTFSAPHSHSYIARLVYYHTSSPSSARPACITSHRNCIIPTTFTYIYLRDFIVRSHCWLLTKVFAFFSFLHTDEPDVFTLAWYHTCCCLQFLETRPWDIDWLTDWVTKWLLLCAWHTWEDELFVLIDGWNDWVIDNNDAFFIIYLRGFVIA